MLLYKKNNLNFTKLKNFQYKMQMKLQTIKKEEIKNS